MWTFFTNVIPLISMAGKYYITGKATKQELETLWATATMNMGKRNRSARDRMDSIEQEVRLNALKLEGEKTDVTTEEQNEAPPGGA